MNIIIPVFVGAIIGYITNWLAIKMLFRPHTEKKIFGIKLPFTPGLIPKEKKRIAKSVGDAVGTHLLTPVAIKQVLSSNDTNEQVDQWLYEKVSSLKNREESLNELITGENVANFSNLKNKGVVNLKKFVLNEINEPSFNKGIISFIEQDMLDNVFEEGVRQVRTRGVQLLESLLRSNDIKNLVKITIDKKLDVFNSNNKLLKESLPSSTENDIRDLLDKNKIKIGNTVRNVFNDPHIHNKLKNSISLMVDENINPMITIFISPDQISEKIMQIVEKYVNDSKSTDDYIMLLSNVIDKLMNTSISEIALNLKPCLKESNVDRLSETLLAQISDEDIDYVINLIEKEIVNSKDMLKKTVLEYLSTSIDSFIKSEVFDAKLEEFIMDSINSLMNMPISKILKDIDDNTIVNLISLLKTTFITFSEHELPKIMELFNVSAIVENQINTFDVEYTEKLILDIADRELKAITWLGALLGGFMGILSPLLQML